MSKTIRNLINTIKIYQQLNESWYHGTPDAREIEKNGGFHDKTMMVDYVIDPLKFKEHQDKMNDARLANDMDAYHKLLDMVDKFKSQFVYKRPLFLTDKLPVAKTYANKPAFDYQNSINKIYEVDVECNRSVRIIATGDRFRYINIDKVRNGFINAGVSEQEIDKIISMFTYYISHNKGIQTDVIAAIANYLNFDCVDVVGVLDSYNGGNIKSVVRMVLDPSKVKIIGHK